MARQRGVEPQVVALSAEIGGVNRFGDWLGCRTLHSRLRPVPLDEGVMDSEGFFQHLDGRGLVQFERLLNMEKPREARIGREVPGIVGELVAELVYKGEKVLAFRNTKRCASEFAARLAAALGRAAAKDATRSLLRGDQSRVSKNLQRALRGGVAFHAGDLSREERAVVEREFREPHRPVRVLVATSTVASGVNTPAETVIVAETRYAGPRGRPFSVATYKNMAGRAGRVGYAPRGRSILIGRAWEPQPAVRPICPGRAWTRPVVIRRKRSRDLDPPASRASAF